MWIRLSLLGDVGHIPESLVRVHSTPNSLSKKRVREQASYVLPMIAAYVARTDQNLSKKEKHKLLGERFGKMGQTAYANGELGFGLQAILRSIGYGYQPFKNVFFLITASTIARRLKQWLLKPKSSTSSHTAA